MGYYQKNKPRPFYCLIKLYRYDDIFIAGRTAYQMKNYLEKMKTSFWEKDIIRINNQPIPIKEIYSIQFWYKGDTDENYNNY